MRIGGTPATAGPGGSPAVRWWRPPPLVRDTAIALVLAVLACIPAMSRISAQFGDLPQRHVTALAVVLVLAQTLPLAVRTRWPAACLAVVGVAFAVHQSLAYPHTFGSIGIYLALYSAGAHQQRYRRAMAVLAVAGYLGFVLALELQDTPDEPIDVVMFGLVLALCGAAGAVMRRYRADEAARRRLEAAAAAAAERSRIARELHDVVTHHVTAMVVQAGAAEFFAAQPDRLVESVAGIGADGRRALAELRRLLGVLEATGESVPAYPDDQETVDDLVARLRRGGQPIELSEYGDRPAGGAAWLAGYRVVQEALTNALKYAAGAPTLVRLGYHPDRIEVEVTTAAPALTAAARPAPVPSGGRGLAGMRERVGALGGTVTAGPADDGGFRVRAEIPRGADT